MPVITLVYVLAIAASVSLEGAGDEVSVGRYHPGGCELRFRAELIMQQDESDNDIIDISIDKRVDNLCLERLRPKGWPQAGLQPLLHITTSFPASKEEEAMPRNTLHTLIAKPGLTFSSNYSNDDYIPSWRLPLPAYLQGKSIELQVKESTVGTGGIVQETKVHFSDPPSVGRAAVNCSHNDDCLDSSTYYNTIALLMKDGQDRFFVIYSTTMNVSTEQQMDIPVCIRTQEEHGRYGSWVVVANQNSSCEGGEGNRTTFTPNKIHLISQSQFYLTGNGLIYNPSRAGIFYQLLLHKNVKKIEYFVTSSFIRAYAAIFSFTDDTCEIWLGVFGSPEIVSLYPSTLLTQLLSVQETIALQWRDDNLTLINASLAFTNENNQLLLIQHNRSLLLPLPLLISHYLFSFHKNIPSSCSSDGGRDSLRGRHPSQLFISAIQPLIMCPPRLCPLSEVEVEAPGCGAVTRSELHVLPEMYQLSREFLEILPRFSDCSSKTDSLPRDIFLEKSQSYIFKVTITVQENYEEIEFTAWTSDESVLNITIAEDYAEEQNKLIYQVYLTEKGDFTGQYESGYRASSLDIDLRVSGGTLQCINPLSTHLSQIPGHFHTRAHIGCPPGLSLIFNTTSTRSRNNQYCSDRGNISCYYYENMFYPVFQILDEVSDIQSTYTGLYSVRALAGGEDVNSMTTFPEDYNGILSEIWVALNVTGGSPSTPIYHNGSGLRWVCGIQSPCSEVLPRQEGMTSYYLLLEASNDGLMENESYCSFSVQFLIQIHGIPLGPIAALVSLLVWDSVMVLVVCAMFGVWHCGPHLTKWRDSVVERVHHQWRKRMSKEWLIKVVKKNKATRHLI